MKNVTPYRIAMSLVACCLLMLALPAVARELPDGTVISKANLDQVKNDTFMGHTIASLLPEHQEWAIRTQGMTFKLGHQREPELDAKYWEATKKYSDQVKFDPKTREITGYSAGMPFPNVDPSDPFAGDKLLWNYYYGFAFGRDVHYNFNFITINRNGFETSQLWTFQRIYNRARLGEAKPSLVEGDVFTKTILAALSPQDVKGIGTYTVRYDAPNKVEESYAYIKSARRTRRLTGNAWMDPIGGFDLLQDDVTVWNTRPSWYKGAKLLGKRWILAGTDGKTVRVAAKAGTAGEFPQIKFPSWDFDVTVTPREVWVVEGTPPAEHPYSKKIVYIDVKLPAIYYGEMYNKKGEFWKATHYYYQTQIGRKSGIKYYAAHAGSVGIDFKAQHATYFVCWGPTGGPELDNGDSWSKYSVEMLDRIQ